jgi:immune inhibitor A
MCNLHEREQIDNPASTAEPRHLPLYAQGPTACVAHPEVVRSIQEDIARIGALSGADVRLAAALGLVSSDSIQPVGFNDGLFYDPTEVGPQLMAGVVAGPPSAALRRVTTRGTLHALCLLVDFDDNQGQRPRQEFEDLLFNASNPDSMTSFYRDLSYGALDVTGEVIGYIRAPKPYSFYTNGESGMGIGFPSNTPGLLQDALVAFCQHDNLARFDNDGDGYVDGIFLVHAGRGAETERDPALRKNMIWSHKWVLPAPFVNNGVKVFAYSTEPEDGKLGVFSHEFGHVLGLPDLYDTSYRSFGIGQWCLMAGGSWGGDGDAPARMSCWCLTQLGWVQPKILNAPGPETLAPLEQDATQCLRVWTGGQAGPEFFLLEHREASGRDRSLPGSGLAVWHIDENRSDNSNPAAYKVGLVQADGRKDLELNRNSGDDGDLFPGSSGIMEIDDNTNPSTRSSLGSPTRVALRNVQPAGGSIDMDVEL